MCQAQYIRRAAQPIEAASQGTQWTALPEQPGQQSGHWRERPCEGEFKFATTGAAHAVAEWSVCGHARSGGFQSRRCDSQQNMHEKP